ncbi:hypothetical protein SAY86_011167 [Trapa natans]|uniref:Uncharacterized protein n=1 Tax=Trapa natans TaxID=22666 RepID=A0AAN7LMT5_TRANT|nr:hypothetical protein SAY86_011167 [Trapa natans]
MRKLGIIICFVIIALDVGAGYLSFQADNAQNKSKQMNIGVVGCREPSPIAFNLGLIAAILLMVAHILTNVIGRCSCLKLAVICNICNW